MGAGIQDTVVDELHVYARLFDTIAKRARKSGMASVPPDLWDFNTFPLIGMESPAVDIAKSGCLYLGHRSTMETYEGSFAFMAAPYSQPPFASGTETNWEWLGLGRGVNVLPGDEMFLQAAPVRQVEMTADFTSVVPNYKWVFTGPRIWIIRINAPIWGQKFANSRARAIQQFRTEVVQMLTIMRRTFSEDSMAMLTHKGLLNLIPERLTKHLAPISTDVAGGAVIPILQQSFLDSYKRLDVERIKPVVIFSKNAELPV